MSSYSAQVLTEKLARLSLSQDSIETLSLWIIHHKSKARISVSTWLEEFKKGDPDRRLILLYLINDVLQNGRRRGALEFLELFQEALRMAIPLIRGQKIEGNVTRMLHIWKERKLYDNRFLGELDLIINPQAGLQAEQPTEFKVSLLDDALTELHKFEAELKIKSSHMSNLRVDINKPAASLEQLKDKADGGRVSTQFNDASVKLQDYCECLGVEVNERINILDMLRNTKAFTMHKFTEFKRMSQNYKDLGTRVNALRDKLQQHLSDLERAASTATSDPSAADADITVVGDMEIESDSEDDLMTSKSQVVTIVGQTSTSQVVTQQSVMTSAPSSHPHMAPIMSSTPSHPPIQPQSAPQQPPFLGSQNSNFYPGGSNVPTYNVHVRPGAPPANYPPPSRPPGFVPRQMGPPRMPAPSRPPPFARPLRPPPHPHSSPVPPIPPPPHRQGSPVPPKVSIPPPLRPQGSPVPPKVSIPPPPRPQSSHVPPKVSIPPPLRPQSSHVPPKVSIPPPSCPQSSPVSSKVSIPPPTQRPKGPPAVHPLQSNAPSPTTMPQPMAMSALSVSRTVISSSINETKAVISGAPISYKADNETKAVISGASVLYKQGVEKEKEAEKTGEPTSVDERLQKISGKLFDKAALSESLVDSNEQEDEAAVSNPDGNDAYDFTGDSLMSPGSPQVNMDNPILQALYASPGPSKTTFTEEPAETDQTSSAPVAAQPEQSNSSGEQNHSTDIETESKESANLDPSQIKITPALTTLLDQLLPSLSRSLQRKRQGDEPEPPTKVPRVDPPQTGPGDVPMNPSSVPPPWMRDHSPRYHDEYSPLPRPRYPPQGPPRHGPPPRFGMRGPPQIRGPPRFPGNRFPPPNHYDGYRMPRPPNRNYPAEAGGPYRPDYNRRTSYH